MVQIRSKMAELQPFNWFQDGARTPFCSLANVNFDGKSGCGTRSLCIKFGGNMWDIDQVMAQNVNFNMAAAAILDFIGYGSDG